MIGQKKVRLLIGMTPKALRDNIKFNSEGRKIRYKNGVAFSEKTTQDHNNF